MIFNFDSFDHCLAWDSSDVLVPDADSAIAAMERMEWVGLTDLFEPSLCLLHYQSNGSLPEVSVVANGRQAVLV